MHDTVSAILTASAGPVALFIDFDGTLVEIAPTPDGVAVPPELPHRLGELYRTLNGAVAIITGRTIEAIDGFLPTSQDIAISGAHGAERRHQGQRQALDENVLAAAKAIADSVDDALQGEPGILIERKPTGVAVHYRAAPEKGALAHAALTHALEGFSDFHAVSGKMVVEARPLWANKGAAIEHLMQQQPFAGRTPIFIGDDVTDEDGFAAAQRLGGFGIRIGEGDTKARFTLPAIPDFYDYLNALIDRQNGSTERPGAPARESMVK